MQVRPLKKNKQSIYRKGKLLTDVIILWGFFYFHREICTTWFLINIKIIQLSLVGLKQHCLAYTTK